MFKAATNELLRYLRTRAWWAAQWPDPQVVYEEGGMLAVAHLLRMMPCPKTTRDILERFGAKIHPDCKPIGPGIVVHEYRDSFANLEIGAHVNIGRDVFFDLTDKIVIEDGVALGMRSVVLTHLNLGDAPGKATYKLFPPVTKPTFLRRNCSVGSGAIVVAGVEVGEDAVVGAGVLVDRDVPPRTVMRSSVVRKDFAMPEKLFRKSKRAPK